MKLRYNFFFSLVFPRQFPSSNYLLVSLILVLSVLLLNYFLVSTVMSLLVRQDLLFSLFFELLIQKTFMLLSSALGIVGVIVGSLVGQIWGIWSIRLFSCIVLWRVLHSHTQVGHVLTWGWILVQGHSQSWDFVWALLGWRLLDLGFFVLLIGGFLLVVTLVRTDVDNVTNDCGSC